MVSFLRRFSRNPYVPVGWTILTITLLCLPGSAIPSVGIYGLSNIDKLVHFILFGVIAITWMTYTSARAPLRWKRWIIVFCLFSIALGIALEFVQLYYIPNRDFDVWDIVADSAGAIFFSVLFFNSERSKPVK